MATRIALTTQPGTTRPCTTRRRLLQLATAASAGLPTPAAVATTGDKVTLYWARVSITAGTTL
ncbi:hypothetical protein ACFWU3_22735 [Streptomyces sp. NPDC058685]|uniref:hypothetical protein n=1 Tax=Streptomyces sp. NPDC058685 TaxID=3346598 RepID=UPI00365C99C1